MTLRRKLVCLHTGFAVFAVVAASTTIYGVRLHVSDAIASFDRLIDESSEVDQLRVDALARFVELRDVVDGRRKMSATFDARRDAFFTRLAEVATFATTSDSGAKWQPVLELGHQMEAASQACLDLLQEGKPAAARTLLSERFEQDLLVALSTRLRSVESALDTQRHESVQGVLDTNTQLLGLAALVGVSCVGLVLAGGSLVRRWLLMPIADLHLATNEFAQGNLDYRVTLDTNDELGTLGSELNTMASSLKASETKYRSLFENLRDAIIICEPGGKIVECRDSDTKLLGVSPADAVGRSLADLWPDWRANAWDWNLVMAQITGTGQFVRAVDLALPQRNGQATMVDVVAYPFDYTGSRYAAFVLRDVSERNRLQRFARRAETMEATETFARGIAHDFKNLLHSAVTSLSLIDAESSDDRDSERVRTALRACQQTAHLSRRLLSFAGGGEGHPEVLCLREMVELILASLDEVFMAPLHVRTEGCGSVWVRMDRDNLTQVVLNLIRNAREAMPDGGELHIATEVGMAVNPITPEASASYAVLTIRDTGCGMSAEVKEKLFEPLFTTKPRDAEGIRGMGLAVVYAAVRHASGFIQVDSEPGGGTTFRVHLPPPPGATPPILAPTNESQKA